MTKDSKEENLKKDGKAAAESLKSEVKGAEKTSENVKKDAKSTEKVSENVKKDTKSTEKLSESAKKEAKTAEKEAKKAKKEKEVKEKIAKKPEEGDEVLKISAILAEVIGTFVLTAAVIKLGSVDKVGMFAISFILALLVLIFGPISGAHLNPAITIALWLNKKVSSVKAFAYIIAQLIGAALALLVFKYLWESGIMSALLAGGVEKSAISSAGGASKYISDIADQLQASGQNYSTATLLGQFGLTDFPNVAISKGAELYTAFVELLGAMIFGLGVGHAVFAEDKPMWETGFSVGFGLFTAASLVGSAAVLNPAIGMAIGAFETTGANMWAGYLIYILITSIGMYAGLTAYRFLFAKSLEN